MDGRKDREIGKYLMEREVEGGWRKRGPKGVRKEKKDGDYQSFFTSVTSTATTSFPPEINLHELRGGME